MQGTQTGQPPPSATDPERLAPEPAPPSPAEEPELNVGEPDIAPENKGDPDTPGRGGQP